MKLDYTKLTALVDTREQRPLNLNPMKVQPASLPTGDYTLKGLEDMICVERKELSDLIGCMTRNRNRFERELARMKVFPFKVIVIESEYSTMAKGEYRSQLNPLSAKHSVVSWVSNYQIPFMFVSDANEASDFVKYYLYTTAQRLFEKYRGLAKSIIEE